MSKVIAIANHKGGVGKTTSTVSIGAALASMGKRVLLIDLDAQANLTSLFLTEDEVDEHKTIYDTLTHDEPLPQISVRENLSITPSSLDLARAEMEIIAKMERERILRKAITEVADIYDFILIDCPPSLGILTTNALFASDEVYIPLTTEALPLKGINMLERTITSIQAVRGGKPIIGGVLLNRFDSRKNLNKQVETGVRARYGGRVFSTMIRDNISVAEAPLHSKDIFSYAPKSLGAQDYQALAEEIIARNK